MATSGVNPELVRERNRASFNIEQLTHILDGGDWFTERRRFIEKLVFEDKGYDGPDNIYLSRDEAYSEGMRKSIYMMKRLKDHGLQDPADVYYYRSNVFPNDAYPTSLQYSMFLPTVTGQATIDQQNRWLPGIESGEIIGTYAQTEMGHGTFLRGMETTANYDVSTEQFDLHSPTLTSTKWWPGSLGKTSNHAVVMARLMIAGTDHGVQPFMVQLRDIDTHRSLPGITLGDIGPKFGYAAMDNGFLRLNHVRIPRENMLMKNAQVLKDGTFVKSKHNKLSYGTMVFVRAMITFDCAAKGLAKACTIALRYSCVRHQSELQPGAPEPQILEYQSQRYKLLPLLASAYAFWFAGVQMRNTYFMSMGEIEAGNVEQLPELHALSSGLKAYTTYKANEGIEVCRMACGGHGYSHASGLPRIYTFVVPACTYEGENSVLYLQTARFLIKCYNNRHKGGLPSTVQYILENSRTTCHLGADFSPEALRAAFRHRAQRLVAKAAGYLSKLTNQGQAYHDAWNNSAVHLTKASVAYVELHIMDTFIDQLALVDDTAAHNVLTKLCQLFAIYCITNSAGDYLVDNFMGANQIESCEEKLLGLLEDLRPESVSLVDAFDFHDRSLESVLGRYDGRVYENLMKWAQEEPLNKKDVHDSFHKYVKPMRMSSKL